MATAEEIKRRIEETDTPRTAKRTAAAKKVGELAEGRAAIAEQLAEVERQLGDVLVDAEDVVGVDELASITDVPAADLTRWLTAARNARKARAKRKRPQAGGPGSENTSSGPSAAKPRTTTPVNALRRAIDDETPAGVVAEAV
jgi:hypothetical protein